MSVDRGGTQTAVSIATRINLEFGVNSFVSRQKLEITLHYTAEQHFWYDRELFSKQLLPD